MVPEKASNFVLAKKQAPSVNASNPKESRMATGRTNNSTTEGEVHQLEPNLAASQEEGRQWSSMSPEEEDLIRKLHLLLGNRWGLIADRLPNRSAEEVESYWRRAHERKSEKIKVYKPVCYRPAPSFKFTMVEPLEKPGPSQT